jgi:AcrR family transcriptional regulator
MARHTKQTLIDAAYLLFGRNGFHAIGVDRILDEVGVSKQTFYNHFESKDDLVLEVLKTRHAYEIASLAAEFRRFGGDDPRAQLLAVFDALDAWFNSPEFRGCIFMTAAAEFPMHTDPAHQVAKEHADAIREQLRYLATLAGATNPRELADELSVLVQGTVAYRHITADECTIAIAKRTAKMLIDRYVPAANPAMRLA